jgi:hypothetical protein
MPLEGDRAVRQAQPATGRSGALEQRSMAEVDTVELPEGHH